MFFMGDKVLRLKRAYINLYSAYSEYLLAIDWSLVDEVYLRKWGRPITLYDLVLEIQNAR